MNEDVMKAWTEALRSGTYKPYEMISIENAGALHCGDGYCIYGVLCELHRLKFGGEWISNPVNKHLSYLGHSGLPPKEILEWIGISPKTLKRSVYEEGDDPKLELLAKWMSQSNQKTFTEMADIIDASQQEKTP